jgi:chemotaxis protein histidine kinase CheA
MTLTKQKSIKIVQNNNSDSEPESIQQNKKDVKKTKKIAKKEEKEDDESEPQSEEKSEEKSEEEVAKKSKKDSKKLTKKVSKKVSKKEDSEKEDEKESEDQSKEEVIKKIKKDSKKVTKKVVEKEESEEESAKKSKKDSKKDSKKLTKKVTNIKKEKVSKKEDSKDEKEDENEKEDEKENGNFTIITKDEKKIKIDKDLFDHYSLLIRKINIKDGKRTLDKIDSKNLNNILNYINHHKLKEVQLSHNRIEDRTIEILLTDKWDRDFLEKLHKDDEYLSNIISAAEYFNMDTLVKKCTLFIAYGIKNNTIDMNKLNKAIAKLDVNEEGSKKSQRRGK